MLEFNGFISGAAEKFYFKKARITGLKITLIAFILLLPIAITFAIKMQNWMIVGILAIGYLLFFTIMSLPKGKKEKQSILPKRISIQDEIVLCEIAENPDSRYVSDVKTVNDYGEFYELVFPTGKLTVSYICQKDLLTKGSIEEFEALFEGKIVRK